MTQVKKTIPCKVCGKQFEPCAYCQSHAETFRWRNFACSRACAYKYIADAEAYREKQNRGKKSTKVVETPVVEPVAPIGEVIVSETEAVDTPKKKKRKETPIITSEEVETNE